MSLWPYDVKLMEHLALRSDEGLEVFCAHLRQALGLPPFDFDAENETAWGWTVANQLEINVSQPYAEGTLQNWDPSVPTGCNIGISLVVGHSYPDCSGPEWSLLHLVPKFSQLIADTFKTQVYHYRTWLGPDQNVRRYGQYDSATSPQGQ